MAVSAGRRARGGACLLFLALHAAAILVDPTRTGEFDYPFLIAAPLIGVLGIGRLARDTTSTVRIAWGLLAAGLLIWLCGVLASAWAELVLRSTPQSADLSNFLHLSYGIAIIAALALPDRPALVRRLFWIDVAQALLAGLLCYVAVFPATPFSGSSMPPISIGRMVHLLLVENLALLALAALRVLGRSHSPKRAAFDRAALLFLALYATGATLYNIYVIRTDFAPGLMSLLVDLPFLSLLLPRPAGSLPEATTLKRRRPLTLLVDGATPAFFTLLLLWLSILIMQTRLVFGSGAMMLALLLMVVRSALTESHHLQAQDALALARDRLLRLSLHDDLTGVANRRAFQTALSESWSDCRAERVPLSLLLIDIDHFKAINDRLGHEAGDTCLRMVANALLRTLEQPLDRFQAMRDTSPNGNLFRYGGEEFAVLLPGTTPARAEEMAERLRAAVFRLAIPNRTETSERVTISAGIASTAHGHTTPSLLISAADRALYNAKANGRNMVAIDETVSNASTA